MLELNVISLQNIPLDTIKLREDLFATPIKMQVLSEVVHWHRSCRRAGTQSALTKAEVRGTNKKPFDQKGRGSARQGSLRGPHQVGGGVAFAPKPREYSYVITKNKKKLALSIALSVRFQENSIRILEGFEGLEPKTKFFHSALKLLSAERALIVDSQNPLLKKCFANLKNSKFIDQLTLNVFDILKYPVLLFTRKAIQALQERF